MRRHELGDHPKLAPARSGALGLQLSRATPAELPIFKTEHVRAFEDLPPDATDEVAASVDPTYDEPALTAPAAAWMRSAQSNRQLLIRASDSSDVSTLDDGN